MNFRSDNTVITLRSFFFQIQQPVLQQTTQAAAPTQPTPAPVLQSQNVSQQLKQLQQQQQQQQQQASESIKEPVELEEESMHLTIQPVGLFFI